MENLGDMLDLLPLIRIPAQENIVSETLDNEHVGEDCSRDLEIGTRDRDDDTRTTRDVPDLLVLQSTMVSDRMLRVIINDLTSSWVMCLRRNNAAWSPPSPLTPSSFSSST